ncbi:MAG: peptidoglycan-binding domain-containing protein [Verrucomicrobiota bacterium]
MELDVQAALRTKGYYTGSLDGIYGPQTADAIRRFQVDNGISMTGKINGDTLKALGL